jgi:hypothetical protein
MRAPRIRTLLPLVSVLLTACGEAPTPGAVPPAVASKAPSRAATASTSSEPVDGTSATPGIPVLGVTPMPETPAPGRLEASFEDVPLGDAPKDWVDVATEATVPAWVYAGNWRVVDDGAGNRVFMHDDVREQPAVSFQRYRGTALGTEDGRLPDRYRAEVAMRPIKSPHNYPPTGDQGVQFYFLGPGRYVEVVIKPDQIEVWEADGAEPKTAKGWKRLWNQTLATKGGDLRRIGAQVDQAAGTFEVWLDGAKLGSVKSAIIKPQPAWMTLRGIGNVVSFDDVRITPIE